MVGCMDNIFEDTQPVRIRTALNRQRAVLLRMGQFLFQFGYLFFQSFGFPDIVFGAFVYLLAGVSKMVCIGLYHIRFFALI